MHKLTMGEAVPCDCHCHQSVYCPECNQPVGPIDEPRVKEAAARIWARLSACIPELRRDMAND